MSWLRSVFNLYCSIYSSLLSFVRVTSMNFLFPILLVQMALLVVMMATFTSLSSLNSYILPFKLLQVS